MKIITKTFSEMRNKTGALAVVESGEGKDVSFPIRRVYYIFDVAKGERRGFHAHKKLEQYLICVHGSCKILLDNGREKEIVQLDKPNEGLYVGPGFWREMYDFSEGAVLLVLASEYYTESDYIRNYDEFLKYMEETAK